MTPEVWLWLLAGVLVLLLVWTSWVLTRLRRLEDRVDRAWTTLDTQLQRRAALAGDAARAMAGRRGPAVAAAEAAAALATAADATRTTRDRESAENALVRQLRELPGRDGVPAELEAELADASTRVLLARRFYNDAVRDTRDLRGRRLPRLLRLHAERPLPRFFDIDDRPDGVASGAGSPDRADG